MVGGQELAGIARTVECLTASGVAGPRWSASPDKGSWTVTAQRSPAEGVRHPKLKHADRRLRAHHPRVLPTDRDAATGRSGRPFRVAAGEDVEPILIAAPIIGPLPVPVTRRWKDQRRVTGLSRRSIMSNTDRCGWVEE